MSAGIKSSARYKTDKQRLPPKRSNPEFALKIMSCFGQLWPHVDGVGAHDNSHCELPGHLLVSFEIEIELEKLKLKIEEK